MKAAVFILFLFVILALALCSKKHEAKNTPPPAQEVRADDIKSAPQKASALKAKTRFKSDAAEPALELSDAEYEALCNMFLDEIIDEDMELVAREMSPFSKIRVNVTDMASLGKQLGELHNIIKNLPPAEQNAIRSAGLQLVVDAALASPDRAALTQRAGMTDAERQKATQTAQNIILSAFKEFNGMTYYDMIDAGIVRSQGKPSAEEQWKTITGNKSSKK